MMPKCERLHHFETILSTLVNYIGWEKVGEFEIRNGPPHFPLLSIGGEWLWDNLSLLLCYLFYGFCYYHPVRPCIVYTG